MIIDSNVGNLCAEKNIDLNYVSIEYLVNENLN